MRTLAVMNQKGGTAKTTTAVNLAAALGERGVPVLLVDLDPQASASRWLGADDAGTELLDLLAAGEGELAALARPSTAPGVDLVPVSPAFAHAERELAGASVLTLRHLVAELPAERWRYVLFDCPPQLGAITSAALLAASEVLVPVEASSMPLAGLEQLVSTIRRAQAGNPRLALGGVVVCRVDRTRIAVDVYSKLSRAFPGVAFETVVRERVRHREAPSHRLPITRYDPDGQAARDYRDLAEELLDRHAEADADAA